jgi:hypothetical protein
MSFAKNDKLPRMGPKDRIEKEALMKVFARCLLGVGLLLGGCQEKEQDSEQIDRMVKIEEEDTTEWSNPQDKQVAGELSGSIQEDNSIDLLEPETLR